MKKRLFSLLILLIALIGFTGCGTQTNEEEKVLKELNDAVAEIAETWYQKGHYDVTIMFIQPNLENYTIINSSSREYISIDGSTEYTQQMIASSNYSDGRMMIPSNEINYILVYSKETKKYFSVKVEYEEFDFEQNIKYDIPKFVSAEEI